MLSNLILGYSRKVPQDQIRKHYLLLFSHRLATLWGIFIDLFVESVLDDLIKDTFNKEDKKLPSNYQ